MSRIQLIWLSVGVIYAAFFGWYTSSQGPLSGEEIERYMDFFESSDRDPQALANVRRFLEGDTGDDFAMLNVLDFYDRPLQLPGVAPTDSSYDVMDKYAQHMMPALLARASHPVFLGTAVSEALELHNTPGMARWDQGAIVRYRSRRDLMEIVIDPAFSQPHDFKLASLQKTMAYPLDPWFQLGDPRLVLALLLIVLALGLTLKEVLRRHAAR